MVINMNVPKPYQGKEKFIFISYSHRDTAKVFPIIFKLMENGYRVWYDQGIDPGTEWDENIATHIDTCGYFIAFMSQNYLGSSNCKDELNYARDLEKDRLIVYLEEVTLPAGMAMRVNRLQSIFKYTYPNEADFYEKLFAASNIEVCLGEKNSEIKENVADAPNAAKEEPAFTSAIRTVNTGTAQNGVYNGQHTQYGQNGYSQPGFGNNQTFYGQQGQTYNPNAQGGFAGNPNMNGGYYAPNGANPNQGYNPQGGQVPPYQNGFFANQANLPAKSKILAAVLAILFGCFGVHKFYLGKRGQGFLYIGLLFVYGISALLALIDVILLLTMSDDKFMKKYNCRIK